MNCADHTDGPNTGTPGTTSPQQPGTSLPLLLRRLYLAMREFCPTWEEWQAAVELRPGVEQESESV